MRSELEGAGWGDELDLGGGGHAGEDQAGLEGKAEVMALWLTLLLEPLAQRRCTGTLTGLQACTRGFGITSWLTHAQQEQHLHSLRQLSLGPLSSLQSGCWT